MEHIEIDEVETGGFGNDVEMRRLTDALGTEDMAINHYRLEPGEGFSGGLHTHLDQEEVFVILSGAATFETEDGTVEVGEGEAVRFAPGEYQTGSNEGDEAVDALALGAPADSTEVRVPVECRECGHEALAAVPDDDGMGFVCPECGTEADLPT
ncbi:cupin domain-containing protein [Halobaculum rubrum]|uniref:cupin domain-containing protein n=1 Tax=Halobaculum rubrum TaxID=2872158 RepID=UPI001CA451D3|nr:cupin domain-containing protein [Halobaculum rubrum]QZX98945.1 cupin domain-containing protein [Halobaculum rubrum]